MREWQYKVNIKQYLKPSADLVEVKRAVARELNKAHPFTWGRGAQLVTAMEASNDIPAFDAALERIYNFADESRVWMGFA